MNTFSPKLIRKLFKQGVISYVTQVDTLVNNMIEDFTMLQSYMYESSKDTFEYYHRFSFRVDNPIYQLGDIPIDLIRYIKKDDQYKVHVDNYRDFSMLYIIIHN